MLTAIVNASELITAHSTKKKIRKDLQDLQIVPNGALVYDHEKILAVGTTNEIQSRYKVDKTINAAGRLVTPGFVDAHTHLVFAGSRHEEYECKIRGQSYADLHKVGGIRYTVSKTREASVDELVTKGLRDLDLMLAHGTTTVEIKTGYGLSEIDEKKILQVISDLKRLHCCDIVTTFLGAHTVPEEYKERKRDYVNLVKTLLPQMKSQAEFCDVWCDRLGFDLEECEEIFSLAQQLGFKLKIHAEQTGSFGGAELAGRFKSISCDHLDQVDSKGIKSLAENQVVGVLLPGVTYHLMEFEKKIPVRELIDGGVPIALATDYNPGTSRTQSMQTILELACRLYKLSYAEAINAATLNAAYAIDRGEKLGSLSEGKQPDVVIFNCQSHGELINNFGINHVDMVVKRGQVVVRDGRPIYA